MKIVEVTVSQSVRVNIGDYEATDFFVSMKAELEEGEKSIEVATTLRKRVAHSLAGTIGANFKARGKDIATKAILKRYGLSRIEAS